MAAPAAAAGEQATDVPPSPAEAAALLAASPQCPPALAGLRTLSLKATGLTEVRAGTAALHKLAASVRKPHVNHTTGRCQQL